MKAGIIDRLHDNVFVDLGNIFNLDVEFSAFLLGFTFFFSLFVINLIILDHLLDLFLITFFLVDNLRLVLLNFEGTLLMHFLELLYIILIIFAFFLTLFFSIFHIDIVFVLDLFVFVFLFIGFGKSNLSNGLYFLLRCIFGLLFN